MVATNQGKIYCIKSEKLGKCYIGSTRQQYVSKRWAQHKYHYRIGLHNCRSSEIVGQDDCQFILLEVIEVNSKEELLLKEREWIEKTENCVNSIKPYTTPEEKNEMYEGYKQKLREKYRNDEEYKQQKKEYYLENKEHILNKIKEIYKRNMKTIGLGGRCGMKTNPATETELERKRQYYEENKERIKAYQKERYNKIRQRIKSEKKQQLFSEFQKQL
jgi:hypothetical protein